MPIQDTKRAISPVVATALLLVLTVSAVVGFQTWFQTYSSGIFTNAESEDLSTLSGVESVVGDELFFKNNDDGNISVDRVVVGDNDCDINTNVSTGIQSINLGSCVENETGSTEVVVYSENEIFSKNVFVKGGSSSSSNGGESASFSLDCSSLPGEWSAVPGNSELGTEDFCVMKYEAKDVSGTPTSKPSDTPWVNINQSDARSACSNLGTGYELITDAQWVTMARNAENIGANWNSSTVGQGSMWRGHSDGSPYGALSVSDTSNYYDQTENSASSIERRVLELSTGDKIWDVGGNVWEWTNDTIEEPDSGLGVESGSDGWHEWPEIDRNTFGYLQPFNSTFNSDNGVGRVAADDDGADPSGTTHAFARGGDSFDGADAGVFTLGLWFAPDAEGTTIGFRCSYTN